MKADGLAAATSSTRRPIERAHTRAQGLREELSIVGAELHLTNAALERSLPEAAKQGDVRKALKQNAVIEEKVTDAADELHEVKELLEEEMVERHRLEQELAARPPA